MTSQLEFNKRLSRRLAALDSNPHDISDKLKSIAEELGLNHGAKQFPDYIDPFNAMAFYNRTISIDKKIAIARKIIEWLNVECDVPEKEMAVPLPNYAQMSFVDRNIADRNSVVDSVWDKFRIFVSFADGLVSEESFVKAFDFCRKIKGMAKDPCRQLAMGLYWVDCDRFVSLDRHVEKYLTEHNDFESSSFKKIDGARYLQLADRIHGTIDSETEIDSFDDLSKIAYRISLKMSDDYDPGITKEQWSELLKDEDVFRDDSKILLNYIIEMGGEASCTQLVNRYGGTFNTYNNYSWNLAKRVHKATNCPLRYNDENSDSYWPILFEGRKTKKGEEGTFIWKIRKELREAIDESDLITSSKEIVREEMTREYRLNTIFYGPPGTGKTYGTVKAAVEIIDGKAPIEYDLMKARYDDLCDSNRIRFVTFHQSYGYEEFIEGIKPAIDIDGDGEDVRYELIDGIFKEFCKSIVPSSVSMKDIRENPVVWKVSLEGTGENETRRECMEKGHIRIGFDQYGENVTDEIDNNYSGKAVLNAFISKMSIGDIIFSCYSSSTIDAIGVVTGDYEWHDEYTKYKRVRKVKWVKKFEKPKNIVDMNGGIQMTLSTVYKLSRISISDVYGLIDVKEDTTNDEKYVFIIDEINRGNVSRIFGELITLVEESKRRGNKEAASVRLPYSKEKFSIPNNLYIIGTMNTADRSLVNLDTALRRRFDFVELMPNYDLVCEHPDLEIDIELLFWTINKRIETLYDREHMIGHSFFMNIKTIEDLEKTFRNNIIPLLQEYFHEDYEKIEMVLSKKSDSQTSPFIERSNENPFGKYDGDDLRTYAVNFDALKEPSNYIMLYEEQP